MDREHTRSLLEQVAAGTLTVDEAVERLRLEPFEDLGFAKVDHHRHLRHGAAEVIYGAGKTPEQIIAIADAMRRQGEGTILITRLSQEAADKVGRSTPWTTTPWAGSALWAGCRRSTASAPSWWPAAAPAT